MVVDKDFLPMVCKYTVTATGPLTEAMFTYYFDVAKEQLDAMLPEGGLPTTTYDHCHALMIVHNYVSKDGVVELESTNDPSKWKWMRPGETTYLRQVRGIIRDFVELRSKTVDRRAGRRGGVTHTDADATLFKMDKT
jgi:hypothetical protein